MTTPPPPTQPDSEYLAALAEAAGFWGIAAGYHDVWGQWHATTAEVQAAILRSLGVATETAAALASAIEQRQWEEWSRLAPPVCVVSPVAPHLELSLRMPEALAHLPVQVDLRLEDGSKQRHLCVPETRENEDRAHLRGTQFVSRIVRMQSPPMGYHEAGFSVASQAPLTAHTRLIVCPDRTWLPEALAEGARRAGLAINLYGVHSAHTWGCGDFTALARVTDWVADHLGGSFLVLNPLCAIHNRGPYNTSPYLPNSVYYRNFIYLDVEAMEDYPASDPSMMLRARAEVRRQIEELNSSEFVEYERVATLKRRFLRLLFRRFVREELNRDTERAARFYEFLESEGAPLDRYAAYCALDEWIRRRSPQAWTWQDWPREYHDPCSEATRRFVAAHGREILFHKYVQWQIDVQLGRCQAHARERGLEIGLFHDLPLATDRCGAELWAYRPFYVSGCRVGAPPDDFSPLGQDWAFPPPDAGRHRADGYRLFAETIRHSARHGGALRIDHVMRLFRLFWIPDGMAATQGAYVRDRFEDLLRIVALESFRQRVLVVGEDLGTVEPWVRETLARFGILSYRLLYFEKNAAGDFHSPADYPAQALVTSTTHDLPTLAGFWRGRDIDARREAGLLPDEAAFHRLRQHREGEKQRLLDVLFRERLLPDWFPRLAAEAPELTGELHNAVTGFLVSTPSLLMALNQEDLTKETEQQNLPGTVHQYPNWRRKMKFSVEELETSAAARDFAQMFRHWLEKAGRRKAAPPAPQG